MTSELESLKRACATTHTLMPYKTMHYGLYPDQP